VRVIVLGCRGGWPGAGEAASGYLVEHDGFRLLMDVGYAVLPRLQQYVPVDELDAVLISHGHPDHCVDLNPLLRARVLRDDPLPPVPVYAPAGALDAVLALDRAGVLDGGCIVHELADGTVHQIGPFRVDARLLPHSWPNAGLRVSVGDQSLAYTGDSGPSEAMVELAHGADLLIAEASFAGEVPDDARAHLSNAGQRGRLARAAAVRRLLLTHLLPGTDEAAALAAARREFPGDAALAFAGLVADVPG